VCRPLGQSTKDDTDARHRPRRDSQVVGADASGGNASAGRGENYTRTRNKFRPFVMESGRFVKQPFPRALNSGYLTS
jgi:hypothetical protein